MPESDALEQLVRAIGSRDSKAALRLLDAEPGLARRALEVGATRQEANAYFFEAIQHYASAGDTALHLAAAAHDWEVAERLLGRGAHVGARNRMGAEPLHYAADGIPDSVSWEPDLQAKMVGLLIGAGAKANALNKSGVAPLHRAVRSRCAAAVQALLEHGADAMLPNKSGSTPLHLAVSNTGRGGSGSTTARAEQQRIIRLLLAHGARPTDDKLVRALSKVDTGAP